jgi:hypothetical protein
MGSATNANDVNAVDIASRVGASEWSCISEHLDAHGWAVFPRLLTAGEASAVAGLYDDDTRFRSHIVMGLCQGIDGASSVSERFSSGRPA